LTNICVDLQKTNSFIKIYLVLSNMKHADGQASQVVFILCASCKENIQMKSVGVNIISHVLSISKHGAARNIVKPASGVL
jgi:hypothetical protein